MQRAHVRMQVSEHPFAHVLDREVTLDLGMPSCQTRRGIRPNNDACSDAQQQM